MANEWVKVELYGANRDGEPRRYTIADGTSVSKGQLLGLSDARTVVAHTAFGYSAGVASEEHVANQGVTDVSLWTDGIFEVEASGAIRVGEAVVGCPGNFVASGAGVAAASGARVIGYALEAADDEEVINVRFRL